jgi:hypothetical protein
MERGNDGEMERNDGTMVRGREEGRFGMDGE